MSKWWIYLILILSILGGLGGVYSVGYTQGKANSEAAQMKQENKNYEELIDRLKSVQLQLDAQAAEFQTVKALLAQKELGVNKDVEKYSKTNSGAVKCLDNDWVRVFNASLPSPTNAKPSSRPDGRTGTAGSNATKSTKQ